MKTDKKIEQMIAFGVNEIDIKEEDYNKLKSETKNLIKLNDIKVNFIGGQNGNSKQNLLQRRRL